MWVIIALIFIIIHYFGSEITNICCYFLSITIGMPL